MTFEEKLYMIAYKEGYYVTFEEIQALANKPSFKKAYEDAYTKGYNKGRREVHQVDFAIKMKQNGIDVELIANITGLSVKEIEKL